jgi:hypothetical protein
MGRPFSEQPAGTVGGCRGCRPVGSGSRGPASGEFIAGDGEVVLAGYGRYWTDVIVGAALPAVVGPVGGSRDLVGLATADRGEAGSGRRGRTRESLADWAGLRMAQIGLTFPGERFQP